MIYFGKYRDREERANLSRRADIVKKLIHLKQC